MDYSDRWKGLTVRVIMVVAWFLGGLPLLGVVMLVRGNLFFYVGPTWLLIGTVLAARVQLFRCPRCNQTFFRRKGDYINMFRSTCANCGLAKGSSTSQ